MSTILLALLLTACGPDDDRGFLPYTLADDQQDPPKTDLDNAPVERATRRDAEGRRDRDDDLVINFGFHGRFTVPFGAANRSYMYYGGGYYYVDHYSSWADWFNPGYGYEMEADIFFGKNGPGHRRSPGFNYGVTLLMQVDEYFGRSESDGFGNSLKVDDMQVQTLQIGGKFIQTMGEGFYYDGLFAIGAVHYSEVLGEFRGPLVTQVHDEFLKETWTFASTFRGDVGYRLGPVGLVLGMGLRILAPPNEGGRFDMNSGAFWTFDINLGAEIGF